MNYKITRTDSENLLVVKTGGKMNADDYLKMAKDLLQNVHLQNGNIIFDHTDLDFNDVSIGDLDKIRAFHMINEERIGSGKSAILVKTGLSGAWHKLWSQGKKIITKNKVRVFENYTDAMSWIIKRAP